MSCEYDQSSIEKMKDRIYADWHSLPSPQAQLLRTRNNVPIAITISNLVLEMCDFQYTVCLYRQPIRCRTYLYLKEFDKLVKYYILHM